VVYSYKYNNDCITPISDPSCPGYIDAVLAMMGNEKIEAYDPLADENIADVIDEKAELDEDVQQEDEEKAEAKDRLQRMLSGVNDSILYANVSSQNLLMFAMSRNNNLSPYYDKKLSGGTYTETVVLSDGELPDNAKGARAGLAQQILHADMVSMQYKPEE